MSMPITHQLSSLGPYDWPGTLALQLGSGYSWKCSTARPQSGVNSFPPFVRCSVGLVRGIALSFFSHVLHGTPLILNAVCAVGRSFQESGFPRSHHAQHDTVGLSSLSGRPCCCILCFMNLVRSMCSAACNGFSTRCAIVAWKSC